MMKIIVKTVKSITCEFAVDCFVKRCKPLTLSHKSRVEGNIKVTAQACHSKLIIHSSMTAD